jgi:hypothetical protein
VLLGKRAGEPGPSLCRKNCLDRPIGHIKGYRLASKNPGAHAVFGRARPKTGLWVSPAAPLPPRFRSSATSLPQLRSRNSASLRSRKNPLKTTQFRSQFAFAVWVPLPQLCSHSAFAAAVDALQVPQHDRIIPTANRQRPVELGEADRSKPNLTSTKYRPAFQSFARAPPALEMCGGAPPPRRAAADAPGAARPPSAVWRAGRSVGSRLGAGHRPRRAGVSGTSRPHCSCPNALQSFPARAASTAPPPPAPNPPPHWGGARGEAE